MAVTRTRKKKKQVKQSVSRVVTAPDITNPRLEDLAVLVGVWDMELSNAAFLPHPSDRVTPHSIVETNTIV